MRKAVDGPVEIGLPLGFPQRKAFAQRRLVDLDHAGAGGLEIGHLVADRQRDLPAGFAARNVVAHERPVEDGDRSGQHRLHRFVGQRLRVLPPPHRHRQRTRDVAEQDRRAHIARAVGLHPGILREDEAGKLLAKILHHVVAFELAMHEDVEADRFLPADRALGLVLQERPVTDVAQLALAVRRAGFSDFRRLRERADGRGREGRQVEATVLRGGTLPERTGAAAHRIVDAGEALRDLGDRECAPMFCGPMRQHRTL